MAEQFLSDAGSVASAELTGLSDSRRKTEREMRREGEEEKRAVRKDKGSAMADGSLLPWL